MTGETDVLIDADRLAARQAEMDTIGATEGGGVHRLAVDAADIEAHRRLADWALARGFTLSLDPIGNMFIRRAGTEALPPVAAGGGTDSQPMAGRFDGMQGVLAAFEALEAIEDAGIVTRHPLDVAIWNNEEGPRFSPACMGSAVYTGVRGFQETVSQTDAAGIVLGDCIRDLAAAIPEAGRHALGAPMAAFLESHIEQGRELGDAGNVIGVVTGMQGIRRWRVDVTGEDAHSGTQSVGTRRDAFVAATDMAVALRTVCHDPDDITRFTIGRFEVRPGGVSVVPGHVHFTIDLRHPETEVLERLAAEIEATIEAHGGPCDVAIDMFNAVAPMAFPDEIQGLLGACADARGYPRADVFSRAGHDARHLSRICPAGMIFIPCRDGISHNEAEHAEAEHCAAAAQVLCDALLRLAR